MTTPDTVLIVDDEEFVRESLVETIEDEGFRPLTAGDPDEAERVLAAGPVHAIVTDLRMPSGGGLALIRRMREQGNSAPILVITGVGTVTEAVEAMKAGAYDLLQKPVDPGQLGMLLRRAIEHHQLLDQVRFMRAEIHDLSAHDQLVGSSSALDTLREEITRVAPTDATVLITGESGAGKELVASEIHRQSPRANGNFVRVHCATIPEDAFERSFFGYRRGAFTGADSDHKGHVSHAEGGTLLLDELSGLHERVQAKLLRFLDGGQYQVLGESQPRHANVRIIATTNGDLEAMQRKGHFRQDLTIEINTYPIRVPALREHRQDLHELAAHFLKHINSRLGEQNAIPLATAANAKILEVLEGYEWPGNARELRNVMERATIAAHPEPPTAELFRRILESALPVETRVSEDEFHLRNNLERREAELLRQALTKTEGRKREAAALLGIDPRNLGYYLRKHDLGDPGRRTDT